MRVAGVRLAAPVARLLADMLESEGHPEIAATIGQAIALQVTTEAPLTLEDHAAILDMLTRDCPSTLNRLRHELAEEERRLRRGPGS